MRILIYLSIILIMAVSFMSVKAGSAFPFILSFCIVPIVITGYFYGIVWAYLVSAIFTAFCIGLTKLGLGILPMLLSVVNFNIVPLIVLKFNKISRNYKQDRENSIREAEGFYRQLLEEDRQIKAVNARFEKDVLEMARLYEITKAMSANMEFSGIFGVLRNVLDKTFKFTSAKLILIFQKSQMEQPVVQKVYGIQRTSRAQLFEERRLTKLGTGTTPYNEATAAVSPSEADASEPTDFDKALVGMYPFGERKPLILGPGQPDSSGDRLKLQEGINSFAATALFSEGAAVGILAIDNMPQEQLDRFLIVASQFELELQKVKLYEKVQQLAIMDGLTGMFVRRYLMERCQDELRRSIKHKLNLSCLIVDIDFFKDCNDKYGHLVGDVILKQIAVIIKENIREVDFVGRYGGEEFCVVLPDTPKAGAVHVAQRLRTAVEAYTFKAYDESIKVTVSVGVSVFPEDASDLNQLIDYADQAMYKAKAAGRNKVCTWS